MPDSGSMIPSQAGMAIGRGLTDGEVKFLDGYYFGQVRCDRIRVVKGGVPNPKSGAMTLDNLIFFQPNNYTEDFSKTDSPVKKAIFVHEVCHVWQFQKRIKNYRHYKALWEHIKYGKDTYKYELDLSKTFADYRFEQMGQMIEDYAFLRETGQPVEGYERIIYATIPRTGDRQDEESESWPLPDNLVD